MIPRIPALLAVIAVAGLSASALAGGECCERAAKEDAWCGACKHGFFGGVSIHSKKLHDALSGKEIDRAKLECAGCKEAVKEGGSCAKCRVGVIKNRAYPLAAYAVLSGERADMDKIKCEGCRKAAKEGGWCESCAVGYVGGRSFKDRAAFGRAVTSHKVISEAARTKCEVCAVAMLTDGACPACNVTFRDGKAERETAPPE